MDGVLRERPCFGTDWNPFGAFSPQRITAVHHERSLVEVTRITGQSVWWCRFRLGKSNDSCRSTFQVDSVPRQTFYQSQTLTCADRPPPSLAFAWTALLDLPQVPWGRCQMCVPDRCGWWCSFSTWKVERQSSLTVRVPVGFESLIELQSLPQIVGRGVKPDYSSAAGAIASGSRA
ncbi:hypothetical protein Pla52n_17050 [Stieleria varia]|uniref:Uncharacterized protein n=1 Tax=Stieleria varia TaxID=2528005 RepID=A0A5C6B3T5_9BACT|nr:hypothetical protein Pla52n_17050 [Stieleria varia]